MHMANLGFFRLRGFPEHKNAGKYEYIGMCMRGKWNHLSFCFLAKFCSIFRVKIGHLPFNTCFFSVERAIMGVEKDKW